MMFSALTQSEMARELTTPMLLISLYASIAGAAFGYDFNYWSGFLGMAQFHKDFGVWDSALGEWTIPSTWQSIATGTPQAALAVGCVISGSIGNKVGRVKALWVAAGIAIVGILLQATSFHSYWQFTVGRVVNSVSMGIICNVVPIYQAECAPTKLRGSLVNTYQFFLLIGAVMAATANWGLYERTDQWAYRIVIILQFIIPGVMMVGGFILPESPRWLVRANRAPEALKVLQLLRRGKPEEEIEAEVRLLIAAEEEQRAVIASTTWVACLRGTNLRRTAIAAGVQCLQNAQGNSFIANYSIVFLQAIGLTDTYKTLILLYFTNMMASVFAFYFADRIGRRPLMLSAACVMGACMYTVAGITSSHTSAAGQKGALAALFIWQFAQAIGWAACVWIVTAEVPTTELRERTVTIATVAGFCVSVIVTYVNPYMQDAGYGNLGGKVGFVYGSFSIVAVVWTFFLLPEMKGRSLEELDLMFEGKISALRFGSHRTEGLQEMVESVVLETKS